MSKENLVADVYKNVLVTNNLILWFTSAKFLQSLF